MSYRDEVKRIMKDAFLKCSPFDVDEVADKIVAIRDKQLKKAKDVIGTIYISRTMKQVRETIEEYYRTLN